MGGRGCVWNDFALIDKKLQYDFGTGWSKKPLGKILRKEDKKRRNGSTRLSEEAARGIRFRLLSDDCRLFTDRVGASS